MTYKIEAAGDVELIGMVYQILDDRVALLCEWHVQGMYAFKEGEAVEGVPAPKEEAEVVFKVVDHFIKMTCKGLW